MWKSIRKTQSEPLTRNFSSMQHPSFSRSPRLWRQVILHVLDMTVRVQPGSPSLFATWGFSRGFLVLLLRTWGREGENTLPIVLLGTAGHVHWYAVLPHLKTIGKTAKCRVFKKWHDEVMVSAFREIVGAGFYHKLPPPHNLVRLDSEGMPGDLSTPITTPVSKAPITMYSCGCRSWWMTPIPDSWSIFFNLSNAPLKALLLSRYLTLILTLTILWQVRRETLPAVWNAAVRKTTQPGFEEHGDVFLVAVFDHLTVCEGSVSVNLARGEAREESLSEAMQM